MLETKSKSITRSFVSLTESVRKQLSPRKEKDAEEVKEKVRVAG